MECGAVQKALVYKQISSQILEKVDRSDFGPRTAKELTRLDTENVQIKVWLKSLKNTTLRRKTHPAVAAIKIVPETA